MDEGTREGQPAVETAGDEDTKSPEELRREIERTRLELGDTVEALGHKTDVKTRVKESVADKRDRVKKRITGAGSTVGDATPDADEVKQGAKRAVGVAQENPIGLAIGSVALGFVAGMLVPTTGVEDEKLGPVADQVKERVKETGEEALERGKEVVQDAAESAKETAQESGEQQAQELRATADRKAQEVKRSGAATPDRAV
jgi:polyhydroxyalkanoate synthesis regulator phasin